MYVSLIHCAIHEIPVIDLDWSTLRLGPSIIKTAIDICLYYLMSIHNKWVHWQLLPVTWIWFQVNKLPSCQRGQLLEDGKMEVIFYSWVAYCKYGEAAGIYHGVLQLIKLSKNSDCLVHDSKVLQGDCLRTKRKFHSTDIDSLHTIGGSGPISLVATETPRVSANAVLTRRRRQLARACRRVLRVPCV